MGGSSAGVWELCYCLLQYVFLPLNFQVLGMSVMNKVCGIFEYTYLNTNSAPIDVLLIGFWRKASQYISGESNSAARITEPDLGPNRLFYLVPGGLEVRLQTVHCDPPIYHGINFIDHNRRHFYSEIKEK